MDQGTFILDVDGLFDAVEITEGKLNIMVPCVFCLRFPIAPPTHLAQLFHEWKATTSINFIKIPCCIAN